MSEAIDAHQFESRDVPRPEHSDTHYDDVRIVRKPRRKGDPFLIEQRRIPWSQLNHTELVELARSSVGTTHLLQVYGDERLHRGTPREELIATILGEVSVLDLPKNPIDKERDKMQKLFDEHWTVLQSQVTCNTNCWECPDAISVQCAYLNRRNFSGR